MVNSCTFLVTIHLVLNSKNVHDGCESITYNNENASLKKEYCTPSPKYCFLQETTSIGKK